MRRQLKVDFAGDDLHGAGESVAILNCGLNEGRKLLIRRFMRQRLPAETRTTSDPLSRLSSSSLSLRSLEEPVRLLQGGSQTPMSMPSITSL